MKKSILFLTISAALFTTSCSDFLDVQPEGDATINTYFTNDQQAIDAVDGLYERFHQEALYGRELVLGTGNMRREWSGDVRVRTTTWHCSRMMPIVRLHSTAFLKRYTK